MAGKLLPFLAPAGESQVLGIGRDWKDAPFPPPGCSSPVQPSLDPGIQGISASQETCATLPATVETGTPWEGRTQLLPSHGSPRAHIPLALEHLDPAPRPSPGLEFPWRAWLGAAGDGIPNTLELLCKYLEIIKCRPPLRGAEGGVAMATATLNHQRSHLGFRRCPGSSRGCKMGEGQGQLQGKQVLPGLGMGPGAPPAPPEHIKAPWVELFLESCTIPGLILGHCQHNPRPGCQPRSRDTRIQNQPRVRDMRVPH